jgi:hypothetical protein
VNPDLQGPMKQPPLSAEAAKKAMAAGVKPAALITHISSAPRPTPTLAVKTVGPAPAKPTPARPAASVKTVKAGHHKARVRWARSSTKGRTKTRPGVASAAKTQAKPALKSVATVKPAAKPSPAIAKGETQ